MKSSSKIVLGKVFTVNENLDMAEAVLIESNRILKVGKKDEISEFAKEGTEIIDCGENLILPGFIDSHVHFMLGGASLNSIDFSRIESKTGFIEAVEKYVKEHNGGWVTGGNWDHLRFEKKEMPRKEWIDSVTFELPAFLTRLDLHMALVNSKALELAGINSETPNPSGGIIMKDEVSGEPTGILIDSAMKLVQDIMTNRTTEELQSDLYAALQLAKERGVTSVHDISTREQIKFYSKLENVSNLTCRLYSTINIEDMDFFKDMEREIEDSGQLLKVGALKAFADGSLGSHTAWFHEPYSDRPESNGLPMEIMENGKLREMAIDADKKGNQLSIHAIGDKAVTELINICKELSVQNGYKDRRFRIEHLQHMKMDDIDQIANLNIIASMQPSHLYEDCCWCEDLIGKERSKGTYAIKSLMDAGVKVCFGSDWTVADLDPIHGIYCAVTRRTKDGMNEGGWVPEEKISVTEAVKAYTINAAYASFEEEIKGSIEEGKLADLVVLDKNIFEIPADDILNTNVLMTMVDGKVVYDKIRE